MLTGGAESNAAWIIAPGCRSGLKGRRADTKSFGATPEIWARIERFAGAHKRNAAEYKAYRVKRTMGPSGVGLGNRDRKEYAAVKCQGRQIAPSMRAMEADGRFQPGNSLRTGSIIATEERTKVAAASRAVLSPGLATAIQLPTAKSRKAAIKSGIKEYQSGGPPDPIAVIRSHFHVRVAALRLHSWSFAALAP